LNEAEYYGILSGQKKDHDIGGNMKHAFQLFDGYWKENFASAVLGSVIEMHEEVRERILRRFLSMVGREDLVGHNVLVQREAPVWDKLKENKGRLDILLEFRELGQGRPIFALGIEVKLWGYGQTADDLAAQLRFYKGWLDENPSYPENRLLFLGVEKPEKAAAQAGDGCLTWTEIRGDVAAAREETDGFERRFLTDVLACLEEVTTEFAGFETLTEYADRPPNINQNEGWDDIYEFLRSLSHRLGDRAGPVGCEDYSDVRAADGWDYIGCRIRIRHNEATSHSVGFYWFLDGVRAPAGIPGGYFCIYRNDEHLADCKTINSLLDMSATPGWFDETIGWIRGKLSM